MSVLYLLLTYTGFLFVLLIINYYINLFSAKDQYTKNELKDFTPHFKSVLQNVKSKYSLQLFILFLGVSSFLGILVPFISSHWIINSSIIFVIIFFTLPYLKKSLDDRKVSEADDYRDKFTNNFINNIDVVIIGFGIGLGTSLMFVWGTVKELNFIWFLINIVIISVLLEISIKGALDR